MAKHKRFETMEIVLSAMAKKPTKKWRIQEVVDAVHWLYGLTYDQVARCLYRMSDTGDRKNYIQFDHNILGGTSKYWILDFGKKWLRARKKKARK